MQQLDDNHLPLLAQVQRETIEVLVADTRC